MTICVSFEILFLQHFLYGPYKAIIYSLKHLWNEKLKKKGKNECWLARDIFSISDCCLYLVSMKTHQSYCAHLIYIFNNYVLKSGQKNTGEAVFSRTPSYH